MKPQSRSARTLVSTFVVAIFLALVSGSAHAQLVITVDSVAVSAGSTDNTLNVTLENVGSSPVTVGGFAFEIMAPTGSGLTFTGVDVNTTPAYIFAGHSRLGPDISNQPPNLPGNVLAALDVYDVKNTGISLGIGASSTVGLGDVHFDVAGTASGPIAITLMSFPTTNISDASGNDITESLGTTFAGGTVTVGASTSVPEPSSLAMGAVGLLMAFRWFRRGR